MTRIRFGQLRPVALLAALAVAASLLAVAPTAASAQSQFQDHGDITSVHTEAVYSLVDEGVVGGYPDGTYGPTEGVTREQMATFIDRALGLPNAPSGSFTDVSGTPHAGAIDRVAAAGIAEGYDDGTFGPRDTITREQMATFLQRAYQLSPSGGQNFSDVSSGGTHSAGIAGVSAALVTQGCTGSEFCPRDEVTREQMASFIARAMGLLRSQGCPTTVGPNTVTQTSRGGGTFPANSFERVGNRLYIFSMDLNPQQLVTYDLSSERVVNTTTIPSGTRTWATHSPEGSNFLYFGQDDSQKSLYRFNTSNNQLQRLGTIGSGVTEFWDITSDDQGRLYLGTSDHGTVYRYDAAQPAAQRFQPLQFTANSGNTNGHVTKLEHHDGVLYIGTGRSTANLLAVDLADWEGSTSATAYRLSTFSAFGIRSLEVSDDVLAAGLENESRLLVHDRTDTGSDEPDAELTAAEVADSWQLRANILVPGEGALAGVAIDPDASDGAAVYTSGNTGTVYRVAPGATSTTQLFSNPPVLNNPNRDLEVYNGELHGVSAASTAWRSTLGSNAFTTRNLVDAGAPAQPVRPQAIAGSNGRIAVSSNNLITLHSGSNTTNVAIPGEPKALTIVGNHLFAAVYPNGNLYRIPLNGPYVAEQVGGWDDTWGRPTDMHYDANNTNRLMISAQVTQNSSGRGAVVNFQRSGPSFTSPNWYQQASNEQGASAITTSGSRTIVGGTGPGRVTSRPTTASSAVTPQWSTIPVPGGGKIMGLETVGNEVHGLSEDGTWFTLNPNSGQVTNRRHVFDGTVGKMASQGNWLYAVTGDCLVAIDTQRNRIETLQTGLGSTTFGDHIVGAESASGGNAHVYVIRGGNPIQVRHTQR